MSGYTRIPHEVFDAIMDMKEAERKISLAICRQTYGFNTNKAEITKAKMVELAKLKKPAVYKNWDSPAIQELFKRDGNQWVIQNYLLPKMKVIESYPEGNSELPKRYSEVTPKGNAELPSTSGLKKERNVKDNLKKTGDEKLAELDYLLEQDRINGYVPKNGQVTDSLTFVPNRGKEALWEFVRANFFESTVVDRFIKLQVLDWVTVEKLSTWLDAQRERYEFQTIHLQNAVNYFSQNKEVKIKHAAPKRRVGA